MSLICFRAEEYIDEYEVTDGARNLVSRTIIEGEENIFYQENIDGILRTKWSIQTAYDESGDATAIEVYSHNYKTGETQLQYRTKFGQSKEGTDQEVETYVEYTDEATNTIHILFLGHLPSGRARIIYGFPRQTM